MEGAASTNNHREGPQQEEKQQQQQCSPSFDDCIRLLKGERDEQRLAGLLLVTKLCRPDDPSSLHTIYDAVGVHFLDRLLRTGMAKGGGSNVNQDAYLQLSLTVLAAFCHSPDIASSDDMISKIPLVLEIMSSQYSPVLEQCYEFLYLVTASCQNGATAFCECGGIKVLGSLMSTMPDGSHLMELAMKIVCCLLSKLSQSFVACNYISELPMVVVSLARQFAMLHNALKFEALHLLSDIFSLKDLEPLIDMLRMVGKNWLDYIRVGVVDILQNRVAPAEKFRSLILAESMVSIAGEKWLVGRPNVPSMQDSLPADRCLLLVLETSRVEVAVLLNDLAYLKHEASKGTSTTAEAIPTKQQSVAILFSLIEKIIKLISMMDNEGETVGESTLIKVINGLNETMNVVLEYLQDAKEHGQRKGSDLLASVRVVGSYLAETPHASKERVRELLEYMLSIEGEDEPSPFYSICFLLPMLSQITMENEGCKALASSGGFKAVVECLIKSIGPNSCTTEDNGCILLACDTVMNVLLKKEELRFKMDESTFVDLLKALGYWAGDEDDPTVTMMASSICALIFDYTSEEALQKCSSFDGNSLTRLALLFARTFSSKQALSDADGANADLLEIVTSGYSRWSHRFPTIKAAVEKTCQPMLWSGSS